MFSETIGIDIGSKNVRIYTKGQGVVLCESNVAASYVHSGEIICIGDTAAEMIGKTPVNVNAILPVEHGVISDMETEEKIIKYFVKKICGRRLFKPSAIVNVPSDINGVCERAITDTLMGAGIREVSLADGTAMSLAGAGVDISRPGGNMICDIGGGKSDISVISMGAIVSGKCIKTAGDSFDREIVNYIKRKKGIIVSDKTAENVKKEIGTLKKSDMWTKVRGRCLLTGLPKSVEITSEEILPVLCDRTRDIVTAIMQVLEITPPALVGDIIDRGIYLSGGGAQMPGIDVEIKKACGIDVNVCQNPQDCLIMGLGRLLSEKELGEEKESV